MKFSLTILLVAAIVFSTRDAVSNDYSDLSYLCDPLAKGKDRKPGCYYGNIDYTAKRRFEHWCRESAWFRLFNSDCPKQPNSGG